MRALPGPFETRRRLPTGLAIAFGLAAPFALAACHPGDKTSPTLPGDRADTRPYAGVAATDTLHVTGTEPFWSGEILAGRMIWKTPDKPGGTTIAVSRFNGRGGFAYSGTLDGATFTMAITPGQCSDGMSDRAYPFVVTLQLSQETRNGCAWSDAHPFQGPPAP